MKITFFLILQETSGRDSLPNNYWELNHLKQKTEWLVTDIQEQRVIKMTYSCLVYYKKKHHNQGMETWKWIWRHWYHCSLFWRWKMTVMACKSQNSINKPRPEKNSKKKEEIDQTFVSTPWFVEERESEVSTHSIVMPRFVRCYFSSHTEAKQTERKIFANPWERSFRVSSSSFFFFSLGTKSSYHIGSLSPPSGHSHSFCSEPWPLRKKKKKNCDERQKKSNFGQIQLTSQKTKPREGCGVCWQSLSPTLPRAPEGERQQKSIKLPLENGFQGTSKPQRGVIVQLRIMRQMVMRKPLTQSVLNKIWTTLSLWLWIRRHNDDPALQKIRPFGISPKFSQKERKRHLFFTFESFGKGRNVDPQNYSFKVIWFWVHLKGFKIISYERLKLENYVLKFFDSNFFQIFLTNFVQWLFWFNIQVNIVL